MRPRCPHRIWAFVVAAALAAACDPVKLPNEMPGPPGCGLRDPSQSGPSMLSVAQQQVFRAQGSPNTLEDNDKGGKTWVYLRQQGSVFGEKETAETFVFDASGILLSQRTETRRSVGK